MYVHEITVIFRVVSAFVCHVNQLHTRELVFLLLRVEVRWLYLHWLRKSYCHCGMTQKINLRRNSQQFLAEEAAWLCFNLCHR